MFSYILPQHVTQTISTIPHQPQQAPDVAQSNCGNNSAPHHPANASKDLAVQLTTVGHRNSSSIVSLINVKGGLVDPIETPAA